MDSIAGAATAACDAPPSPDPSPGPPWRCESCGAPHGRRDARGVPAKFCSGRCRSKEHHRRRRRDEDRRKADAGRCVAWYGRNASLQCWRFHVRLPPLAEQREIVRRIEAAFARIDAIEAVVAEQRARLDAYDRSLLARAFAGELVPQDPADEPAAASLAWMRAERERVPIPRKRRRW